MTHHLVEHHASVTVDAPSRQVYELFTHFNDFPKFMSFVKEVTYYDDQRNHWVADIVGECDVYAIASLSRSHLRAHPCGRPEMDEPAKPLRSIVGAHPCGRPVVRWSPSLGRLVLLPSSTPTVIRQQNHDMAMPDDNSSLFHIE
jgi:hypothetical protein